MDDLGEKINRLLSSPDGMAKIQAAMATLGGAAGDGIPPASPGTGIPALAAPPPSVPNTPFPTVSPPASSAASAAASVLPAGIDPAMLGNIAPLIGKLGGDDNDARLLQALRPYLHGEREHRLDDAIRLLRLVRLLPLLQEGGVLPALGKD